MRHTFYGERYPGMPSPVPERITIALIAGIATGIVVGLILGYLIWGL